MVFALVTSRDTVAPKITTIWHSRTHQRQLLVFHLASFATTAIPYSAQYYIECMSIAFSLGFHEHMTTRPPTMACALSPREPMSRKETVLTRRQIEGMIADGKLIIIVDGKVLRVDAWLKYHPGGDKAIMHMVGRDATDEVNAYVNFPILSQCQF